MDAGGTYCLPRPEPLGFSADAGVWLHFHFVLWLLLLLKMLQRHRHDLTHGTQQKKCEPVGIALTVFGSCNLRFWVRPWAETNFANF